MMRIIRNQQQSLQQLQQFIVYYIKLHMDFQQEGPIRIIRQKRTKYIRKCQQSDLHFFNNPQSPYQNSPKQVQQIFIKNNNDKSFEVSKIGLQFKPRPGKTNLCTRIFPTGTVYYTCRQCCCQTKIGTTMCFCLECWVPEKHIGHSFRQGISSGSAYCDCGRESRIKPQSFCLGHSQQGKIILQIPQQQRIQYKNYFESLIMCYLYLRVNGLPSQPFQEFQIKLNKRIEQLCIGSLYYIRLTAQIMNKKVILYEKQRTILEWFICLNEHCQKLFFAMIADDQFKYQIIKSVQKLQSQNQSTQDIRLVKSEFYQKDSIFFIFAEKGEFIQSQNKRYVQIAIQSQQGSQLFLSYLKYQKNKIPNQQTYLKFLITIFNQKSYELIMKNKDVAKLILFTFLNKPQETIKFLQELYVNFIPIIAVSLFSLVDKDINRLGEIQAVLALQSNNLWQNLKVFLHEILKYPKQYIIKSGLNNSYWFVILLRIMIISEQRQQYVDQLWQSLKKPDLSLNQDFIQTLSVMYQLTSLISSSFVFFNSFLAKHAQNQALQEERQKWVKSFLYENGQVSRTDILKMRQKGQFKFPNAGQKLKQLCLYNQARDFFQYKSKQKYPNYLLRFKANRNVKDLKNINTRRFKYLDEFQFDGPKYISQTLQAIFTAKSFFINISQTWNKKLNRVLTDQVMSKFWKNYQLGFYYLFTLVYANVLSKKNNQFLIEQIKRIRQNPRQIQKYQQFCIIKQKIQDLLQIQLAEKSEKTETKDLQQKKIEESKQQQQEQNISKLKMKQNIFNQKLKRIKEKFKKTSQKFMQEIKNNQPAQSQVHQDQCIICRECGKADNALMYISTLDRNSSIAFSLYGNEDKTQINIKSCFHLIHYTCFLNINKGGFDFNCPLCSKKSNIYIPTVFDKKSIRRCSNLINAIQVTKNKTHDFHFLLQYFIRHLVGNYALNSVILSARGQKQINNNKKLDAMILKMAQNLAKSMNMEQKQQFVEQMNKLMQSMELVKKQPIRKVQKFFTKTLLNKITGKQEIFNINQLLQIKNLIIPQEFQTLKQNLDQIVGQKIQLLNQQNENIGQKQMIGIKIKYPPQNFQNFDSFFQKNCQLCKKEPSKSVCLLCKNSLCQQCLSGAIHTSEHNSNYFILLLDNKKILIRQQGGKVNGSHNIYFDAFMTAFEDSSKYNSQQIYELNKSKIQRLISSYLLRI